MIIEFVHKPVNHISNKRCWALVPLKQRDNEIDFRVKK